MSKLLTGIKSSAAAVAFGIVAFGIAQSAQAAEAKAVYRFLGEPPSERHDAHQ